MSEAEQLNGPIDPKDKRSMELLHKRVSDRALSLRWNLNGLMFVYALLIIVVILTLQNINTAYVAVVAVVGLVLIWLYSSLRLKKLEEQFYQQEILDHADLAADHHLYDSGTEAFVPEITSASPLTPRELEILAHMAQGKRNKEIASVLKISESTVKNHISNIFEKLDIYDRIPVVLLAINSGWIKYDSQYKHYPDSGQL